MVDTILCDKLCEHFQHLGVPLHSRQVVKAMYTYSLHKTQINGDTYDGVISNIGVKQGCPFPPTLCGLYIDELETYLDEINGVFMFLFNTMFAILLFNDNVVMLSKSGSCLQRPKSQSLAKTE